MGSPLVDEDPVAEGLGGLGDGLSRGILHGELTGHPPSIPLGAPHVEICGIEDDGIASLGDHGLVRGWAY